MEWRRNYQSFWAQISGIKRKEVRSSSTRHFPNYCCFRWNDTLTFLSLTTDSESIFCTTKHSSTFSREIFFHTKKRARNILGRRWSKSKTEAFSFSIFSYFLVFLQKLKKKAKLKQSYKCSWFWKLLPPPHYKARVHALWVMFGFSRHAVAWVFRCLNTRIGAREMGVVPDKWQRHM